MSLLDEFRTECKDYYTTAPRDVNAISARIDVYRQLLKRHNGKAIGRHCRTIAAVLDRAELEYARGDARRRLLTELQAYNLHSRT